MAETTIDIDDDLLGGWAERLRARPTCTVEEAAHVLGLSRPSAYAAARRGELPTLRIGRRLVVPTARLLRMLGEGDATDVARPVA